tara:strand:- start:41 stop:1426 length:1386 start_codon:yes stop_codon:yes gene_type:complete
MLKKISLIVIIAISGIYILISFDLAPKLLNEFSKNISVKQKLYIKRTFFPLVHIRNLNSRIEAKKVIIKDHGTFIYWHDFAIKQSLENLVLQKSETINLKDLSLDVYKFEKNLIMKGVNSYKPGTGYLDFYDEKLFFVSSIGIFAYAETIDAKIIFKQIKNNIHEFAKPESISKSVPVAIKDLAIIDSKVFVSYSNELKKDCWNTALIYAELNYQELRFEKLYEPAVCNSSINPKDGSFNAHQSGGRIEAFEKNSILFSHGDYRYRSEVQSSSSAFGKIIKINLLNKEFEIIAKGFRNPQGLYYDKEKKIILETEHGPFGGDEINLIKVDDIGGEKMPNYGWPIASYGEHYPSVSEVNRKKYPLLKSHKKNGFIEPIKSFSPAIGISEIIKIGNNKYLFGTMRNSSFYTFELNKDNELINLKKFFVDDRVRDIAYMNNKVYLFLETVPSITIIQNTTKLEQ